ncbi:trans-3-hydroxy-L-proline dehydratase [Glutamicibacter uratoxydans]|uniref:Trans-3-hydroxy-L-proline dehydratase n=1 Tax=Glutamicibacter uratoxydans TaxID=43667 RepID=A0A4Y4DNP8_GLUUR|nr:proline racemase family protein [Glutamicibacter uratoxydans]GED04968.1 trans-3-hydroxy-L-proline dehydratase [Glutamicibacter uratoxydans]
MNTEKFHSIDYHTAGEPFRIITELPVVLEGADVPAKRVFAMNDPQVERIRKILCFEPRGHADMYGGFITEPNDAGAHFGVLFWHKDGFSTACGHGTIALGIWAVEHGKVTIDPSGVTDVVIDVPSGRVVARVHTNASGEVTHADFINVASYVLAKDVSVPTALGEVLVDVTFGGAIYAQLDAASVGLSVTPENYGKIIEIGREIKWALNDSVHAQHPSDPRLSGIYGTIVFEDLSTDSRVTQRNATVFADGEVDRSPCGSGTSARVATLTERGVLAPGQVLEHGSIVGSTFQAVFLEQVQANGYPPVIPQVTGTAFQTGEHTFIVDPRDDLTPGFVLR